MKNNQETIKKLKTLILLIHLVSITHLFSILR